ncbi:hypothetical protein HM1_1022 [Heliomicrobium modesticaldum Ice1]|uniref:Uncharacterized protein n=1 Tax=Heliobacterium modesticaldum (strain ATCC 51547 / Ice1) TaxID=498761 RepID=B0TID2_HELMI|nr:hypothetical protein HM1_1022 [Heliomicrobium modesticaldum Ice1]
MLTFLKKIPQWIFLLIVILLQNVVYHNRGHAQRVKTEGVPFSFR